MMYVRAALVSCASDTFRCAQRHSIGRSDCVHSSDPVVTDSNAAYNSLLSEK